MAMSTHVPNSVLAANAITGSLLEKVITSNDLGGLSPVEKVTHIKAMCDTLGLNPLTKPIQLIKFQGKEIAYFTREATEQLRKLNKVSITKIEPRILEGGLYVVTAYAETPDGRTDSSTGAIVTLGKKGDDLANAMMKCETKAKRRVTLSICGLGYLDESELDTMPKARKVDAYKPVNQAVEQIESNDLVLDFSTYIAHIESADSMAALQEIFSEIKKLDFGARPDLFKKLIEAKDKRKGEITVKEFNAEINAADPITGEVK